MLMGVLVLREKRNIVESRIGTAHYDITWLSPIPGEVMKSDFLPTPVSSCFKLLKGAQFPRVQKAPWKSSRPSFSL